MKKWDNAYELYTKRISAIVIIKCHYVIISSDGDVILSSCIFIGSGDLLSVPDPDLLVKLNGHVWNKRSYNEKHIKIYKHDVFKYTLHARPTNVENAFCMTRSIGYAHWCLQYVYKTFGTQNVYHTLQARNVQF